MKWLVRMSFVLFGFLMLPGCAQLGARDGGEMAQGQDVIIAGIGVAEYRNAPKTRWVDGEMVTLYLDQAGRIAFRKGGKTVLLDEDARVKTGKYISLYQQGKNLYAFWWSHQDGKSIYSRVSTDGGETFNPVREVQVDHGVLPPYEVVIEDAAIGVVYSDERKGDHHIYFNRSANNGETWGVQDIQLDAADAGAEGKDKKLPAKASHGSIAAYEANLVKTDGAWIVTWQESEAQGDATKDGAKSVFRIVSRRSSDRGLTWSKEVEIYRGEALPSTVQALSIGKRIVVAGELQEKGVTLFTSDDTGLTWVAQGAAPGSDGLYNSQVRLVADSQNAYLVFASKKQDEKSRIHAATFNFPEKRWVGETVRIDTKTQDATQSMNPDIEIIRPGVPMVIWEDYRNIRPNIYMSYSIDAGKTWRAAESLEVEGKNQTFFAGLNAYKNKIWLFAERYTDDLRQSVNFVGYALDFDDKAKAITGARTGKAVLSQSEKVERLKERAGAFWSLRVANNTADQYEFYDFAYRGAISKADYDKFQGNIVYHSFEVEEVEVQDNLGKATIKFNFSVPLTTVMGSRFTQPAKDARLTSNWVWVYDDWYLVHQTAMGNQDLVY